MPKVCKTKQFVYFATVAYAETVSYSQSTVVVQQQQKKKHRRKREKWNQIICCVHWE